MNCLATGSRYASLVKFSHTIFALPFALVGYVYALQSNGLPFEWPVLVKVLLAMVLARNTACLLYTSCGCSQQSDLVHEFRIGQGPSA